MPQIELRVDKGTVTATDPYLLKPGELQTSEGVVYQPGDPAAHKQGGRTALNSSAIASQPVNGIKFVDFDSASDRVLAQVNGALYSAVPGVGTFGSIRSSLTASATMLDAEKADTDQMYMCNGVDANWVVKNDNTTYNHGLASQTVAPTGSLGGTGITGSFYYWTTEYDSTNGVESANSAATLLQAPANQTVTITKPATINSSATHWRLYRTKDTGSFPIGWLVATTVIGTTTYADSTTDVNLVLADPFNIVTINGLSEAQDFPAPVFKSLTFFEGSLVGVANRSLYYSETYAYHSFPVSYAIPFHPRFGGFARCVRRLGRFVLIFFDHDTFRVNYLPKGADSFFDSGVAQEHVCNYGTVSPNGAVVFSGWGGQEMCLFASRNDILLTDGNTFDSAVSNIDWQTLIPPANQSSIVMIDDPDNVRVRLYYNYSASDSTLWKELHFYYDSSKITHETGFPELVWTGPHLSPGPGTFAVVNGVGVVYTGSKAADGYVYLEDQGATDAAHLVDSSGTVNFNLRTLRVYPQGVGGSARVERCYIHKASAGSGNYTTTVNVYNEGDQQNAKVQSIDATKQGASSKDFSASGQSFDVQVGFSNTSAMPAINSIIVQVDDMNEDWAKTNRR